MKPEELLRKYLDPSVDRSGMLELVLRLPDNLASALREYGRLASTLDGRLPKRPRGVVIAGMGGSFIGGLFVQDALYDACDIPVLPLRETELPAFVNKEYLVIAVSYSGNTEETIRVLLEAFKRKTHLAAVASGGLLEEAALKTGIPFVKLPAGIPPRAAFPFMCAALAVLLDSVQESPRLMGELEKAANYLKEVSDLALDESEALSRWMFEQYSSGKMLVVYSYRPYLSAGYRLKTQINENAKLHAFFSEIPESNHNEIMGWEGQTALFALLLRAGGEPPYIRYRLEFLRELLSSRGVAVREVVPRGETRVQELLYLFYAFDIASVLLSLMRGVDPTPVETISRLKKYLDERINIREELERTLSNF
ncbi:MAG: bifunctional phosphoglucose/phosphomannose isomerase [Thermofilum sp.]|nr:bifunctional phosphoglucose/phosphomannose isomerase [Thermofilum sp.]